MLTLLECYMKLGPNARIVGAVVGPLSPPSASEIGVDAARRAPLTGTPRGLAASWRLSRRAESR